MAKADRIVSLILPGPLLSLDTHSERHDRGGTIHGSGEPSIAAIFGPGGPILRGDHPRRDRTKERESEGRKVVLGTLLKLLVKDKLLHNGEGHVNEDLRPPRREKRGTHLMILKEHHVMRKLLI